MFVGRKRELEELARLYNTECFQCVVIYGRRRIGKTSLIAEFLKNKESVYFTGQETNAKENLENLSDSIFSLSMDFFAGSPRFPGYKEALESVFIIAEKRRVILAIDEFPYLAASYKGISSLLQILIDKYKESSKLFLIICGSSLSFMENQVLGYKSPLFGRRTAQFKIPPFDYAQSAEFFGPSFSAGDIAVLYGVTGGIPLYMSLIDRELNLADNIKNNFLKPAGYLFEETVNLIKQECREPAQYNAIIRAIADGAAKLSEIAGKTGLETSVCSAYISNLISIGVVKKERPFLVQTGKKTIYRIADSMFRFWYRFVPGHMSLIQRGESDIAYKLIEPLIPGYMGAVFEEICLQYLWDQNVAGRLPFLFTDAGRWWGNDPVCKKECEVDILACDGQDAILCECKWTNNPVDTGVLSALMEKGNLFRHRHKYFYLFAKTGFTAGVRKKATEHGNMALICFTEMYGPPRAERLT